jgi:hypothetical protein
LRNGNYEECAQTKIFTAALVCGYMKLLGRFPKDIPDDFRSVFPNLDRDFVLYSDIQSIQSMEGEICQSYIFSDEGFVDLLYQAIIHLKKVFLFLFILYFYYFCFYFYFIFIIF